MLTVGRGRQESEQKAANAKKVTAGLESLLQVAKKLQKLDKEDEAALLSLQASLAKALDRAEKRASYIDYIPSLEEEYPMVCFEDVSEAHMIDLVWAFQSLDKFREGEDADNEDKKPSFYKMLHYVQKAALDGEDEQLTKRWTPEYLERFWQQLVGNRRMATELMRSDLVALLCSTDKDLLVRVPVPRTLVEG